MTSFQETVELKHVQRPHIKNFPKNTHTHTQRPPLTETPQWTDDNFRNWVSSLLDSNQKDWPCSTKCFQSPLKLREPGCFPATLVHEEA